MEASAVLASGPMTTPILPEIGMSGLDLLTELLMDGQPAAADAIINLPLPEPLPPEQIDSDDKNEQEHVEEPSTLLEAMKSSDSNVEELLPPIVLEEHPAKPVEHSETGKEALSVFNNGVVAEYSTGGDIAAYFALEFLDMQYIYYLQRSSVSLGRSSNDPNVAGADIDLGPLKNISRLHARIEYEEELERFVLAIIGRNGAYVDGVWKEPGKRIPLGDRTLIQISTRAFYFILPHSSMPTSSSPGHAEDGDVDHEVPALDSTVTTAEDEDDSQSTSASATPKQVISLSRRRSPLAHGFEGEDIDDDIDDGPHLYGGKGKGKGKGKEAFIPAKRGRGRPRKNSVVSRLAETTPAAEYDDADLVNDVDMLDFSESDEDNEDDGDGDFVPKKTKGPTRKKGGLGKTRSTGFVRVVLPKQIAVDDNQDEPMSDESHEDGTDDEEQVEPGEDGLEGAMNSPLDSTTGLSFKRLSTKRKREATAESADGEPPVKRRKSIIQTPRPSKTAKKVKASKGGKNGKESLPKGRKKSNVKPEMKSLFTTTPAPALSAVVAASVAAEAAAGEAGVSAKAGGKKGKTQGKKGKKEEKTEKGDGEDEETVVKEEEAKPTGPPPPKPPFTYPLLCYRALKALDGKAAYRAITKWLETEYPYFAAATKEGKDGWENSTRHTLSSHRAFIKIDRKPEERGKGCFWSFDPEFEEQFKDQWRAAESQARNPRAGGRPPNPPPGPGPNGLGPPPPPGMYPRPPPFGQPGPGPGWSGVTPPHLMPGYRPMVPGAGPPGPYPFPPGVPRPPGMLPHPPMHPMQHPLGMPPPPSGIPGAMGKVRAPKKPKQALGAAFSRAPLIRPGLGGMPSGESSNAPGPSSTGGVSPDEAIRRGEHAVRMAARAAKDEMSGRAPPGTTLVAATGGWGMAFPPPPPVNGTTKGGNAQLPAMGMPSRPGAATKVSVVLGPPPSEALPPHFSPQVPPTKGAKEGSSSKAEDDSKSPEASSTTSGKESSEPPKPSFRPPVMPMTFFKGTLYLDPKAYPNLESQDIEKMGELGVGDAMQYLLTRSGSKAAPPAAAAADSNASVSPERDVKAEE